MEESKITLLDRIRWRYWDVRFWLLRKLVCRWRDHDVKYDEDYWAGDQHVQQWPYCNRCGCSL